MRKVILSICEGQGSEMGQAFSGHATAYAVPGHDTWPGKGRLALLLLAAFLLLAVVSACGSDDPSQSAGAGDQAPAFTLPDQSGETYTFTPGDGKDHVLVFYMGYF